ncbi:MAG: peptide chain release factor N(5)-glutamine methyltransferase [Burkholderiales bacterium]|nr:peptide chain release factor N(5)-glutamine methyltransferase [Burkholderiales bacterium]
MRDAGLAPPDGRILLQHVLGVPHAQLGAHPQRVLTDCEWRAFARLVQRRRAGEPIAYLIGEREFYGRRFRVTDAVLIPRPETELLIDLALERYPESSTARILDLGTGSGNIAVTLALERPRTVVAAVDCSPAALALAGSNARELGALNVRLLEGDWYAPVAGMRFDLIVSNPPYVAAGDPHLGQGDVRFEPRAALNAGADGLDALRAIVAAAPRYLDAGGWLIVEHGYDQGAACARLLRAARLADVFLARDLAGSARVSGGRKDAAGA